MPLGVHGFQAYESRERPVLGSQWLIDLFDCQRLTDAEITASELESLIRQTSQHARLSLAEVSSTVTESGHGWAVGVATEGHVAMRFSRASNCVLVDLMTTGSDAGFHEVCDALARYFQAAHHSLMVLNRGDQRQRRITPAWTPPSATTPK